MIVDRFVAASAGFEQRLVSVRPDQWDQPTPCSEWNVRQLVNHMTQGNFNYVRLAQGATAAEFLRNRDLDALGSDPLGAFRRSVRDCAEIYARPGVLEHEIDYPAGRVSAGQILAVRTTDSVIHTWDLARAIGADERLDDELVAWIDENLVEIYAGMPEMPTSTETTHKFFAAPHGELDTDASTQDRLLHLFGRTAK